MSNLTRDIGTEDLKIEEFVKLLKEDKLLVPTFQRDFVWEPSNILLRSCLVFEVPSPCAGGPSD